MNSRYFLALLAVSFSVQASSLAGDPAAGRALANRKPEGGQACVECHGSDGDATTANSYPRLAGQYPEYLANALRDYRSGRRGNAIMANQVAELSDQDINNLAAYFGSLDGDLHDLSSHPAR
jgi:cytochrome c553